MSSKPVERVGDVGSEGASEGVLEKRGVGAENCSTAGEGGAEEGGEKSSRKEEGDFDGCSVCRSSSAKSRKL